MSLFVCFVVQSDLSHSYAIWVSSRKLLDGKNFDEAQINWLQNTKQK